MRIFHSLSRHYDRQKVWEDFILMQRYSLEFAFSSPKDEDTWQELNKIKKSYTRAELELFANMIKCLGDYAESSPYDDFLGELYMTLELGNKSRKDYYTPPDVARLLAFFNLTGIEEIIDKKGWVSVADFCCGSGGLLLAFAHTCWEKEIDPTRQVLYVAQDVSYTAVSTCYLQMSVQCLPGFVACGNSLTEPLTGSLFSLRSTNDTKILETHTLSECDWRWRRVLSFMRELDIVFNAGRQPYGNQ